MSVASIVEPAVLEIVPEARCEPAGFVFKGAANNLVLFKALEVRRVIFRHKPVGLTTSTPRVVLNDVRVGIVAGVDEGHGIGIV
jgi:hypothetical protein